MSNEYRHFRAGDYPEGQDNDHDKLRQWHNSLYQNKGERAALRRATCLDDIYLTNGFRRLCQQYVHFAQPKNRNFIALACVAGVLAHVKEDLANGVSFARQLGESEPGSDKPKMSMLRFNQLQQAQDWDEFYRRMIRAVRLLDQKLNIVSLADAIFHWGKELAGEFDQIPMNRLKVRWAMEYYQPTFTSDTKQDQNTANKETSHE